MLRTGRNLYVLHALSSWRTYSNTQLNYAQVWFCHFCFCRVAFVIFVYDDGVGCCFIVVNSAVCRFRCYFCLKLCLFCYAWLELRFFSYSIPFTVAFVVKCMRCCCWQCRLRHESFIISHGLYKAKACANTWHCTLSIRFVCGVDCLRYLLSTISVVQRETAKLNH